MKPINRTTTLIYKKGRRVKVEKHVKRIYYPDHNNPKVLKPIITEPKDAKVYYTGYKHEIIDHDLLIGFSPKYNDLPFLRFTDPKTENTWVLWIKGFGDNVPKTGIRPKMIERLEYGMRYEIDQNTELIINVAGHAISKEIVVHKRPEWNELTFIISRFGGHLITGKTFGKNEPLLAFRKNDVKPLFKFLRPVVRDSGDYHKDEIPKVYRPMIVLRNIRAGVWELKIKISDKWLDEAKYPIYIDPSLEMQPDEDEGKDARILSTNIKANWGYSVAPHDHHDQYHSGAIGTWNSTYDKTRFIIQFDLSDIPSGANINSADLKLYPLYINKAITIECHRLVTEWNEGNKHDEYNTADDGECCWKSPKYNQADDWDGGDFDSYHTDVITDDGIQWYTWDVTQQIQNSLSNNKGLILKKDDDSYYDYDENGFVTSGCTDWTDKRPKLIIEYTADDIYWKIHRVGWEGEERPFVWIFD